MVLKLMRTLGIQAIYPRKKVNTSLRVIMEQHKASDAKATKVSMERRALLNRQLPHRPNQA